MDSNFVRNGVLTRLGGTDNSFVIPKFNLSKFNDEFWVDVNHKESFAIPRKDVVQSNISKYDVVCGNIKHTYYQKNDGLEYEMWFQEKPKPEVILDLTTSEGLTFTKQLELTQKDIDEGWTRPEDIVNSFAVYCNKSNFKYETGKIAHLKRPFLVDSKGRKVWCDQEISGNVWLIQLPEKELDDLSYPICLGPEIGYSTSGSSNYEITKGEWIFAGGQSSGYGGQVNFIKAYITSSDVDARAGIYSGTTVPQTKAFGPGESIPIINASPYSFPIGTWTLLASTNYWPTLECDGDTDPLYIKYDSTTESKDARRNTGDYYPTDWPNSMSGVVVVSTIKYSLWLDFTEVSPPTVVQKFQYYYTLLKKKNRSS